MDTPSFEDLSERSEEVTKGDTKSSRLFSAVRHAIIEASLKLGLDLDDCDWSIEAEANPTLGYIPNAIKVVISLVKRVEV